MSPLVALLRWWLIFGPNEAEAADGAQGSATVVETAATTEVLPQIETLSALRWVQHRVAPRETLDQIAHRYHVSPSQLREWNGLSYDTEKLKTRARLKIKTTRKPKPRRKLTYAVKPGDTWWRVAVTHGVDPSDLRAYNWPYRGKMKPGSELLVWVDPVVYDWIQANPPDFDADDSVIRVGGFGIGPPDAGHLVNGVRLPPGNGYELRFPKGVYGTTHAVGEAVHALHRFRESTQWGGTLRIGAMSRPRGGRLGTHLSHQTGRDLDVRLPRREAVPRWYTLTLRRVDWIATWDLVRAFAEQDVSVIFLNYKAQRRLYKAAQAAGASEQELRRMLQYPRGPGARRGVVRHSSGHTEHLHVRFGCGPHEVECVEGSIERVDSPPSAEAAASLTDPSTSPQAG